MARPDSPALVPRVRPFGDHVGNDSCYVVRPEACSWASADLAVLSIFFLRNKQINRRKALWGGVRERESKLRIFATVLA